MPAQANIFQILAATPDVCIDQAMVTALSTAEEPWSRQIVVALLNRKHPRGLVGLIQHYHQLSRSDQALICAEIDHLTDALRQISSRGSNLQRQNMIELIRQRHDPRLAYLLAEQLRYGPAKLHAQAARALAQLTQTYLKHRSSAPDVSGSTAMFHALPMRMAYGGVEVTASLIRAISQAVLFFQHHRQQNLLDVMLTLMPRPMPQLSDLLATPTHPATRVLTQWMAEPDPCPRAEKLLCLLNHPALTEATLQGINWLALNKKLPSILTLGHLLKQPSLQKILTQHPDTQVWANRMIDQSHQAPPQQASWIATWLHIVTPNRKHLIQHLWKMRKHVHRHARLQAVHLLVELAGQKPDDLVLSVLADYCQDAEPAIARIALRQLIRLKWEDLYHLLLKLVNGQHLSLRRIAGAHIAPVGFEKLWENWSRLNTDQQLAAGKALIKLDPTFHLQLEHKLHDPDEACVLKAMAMIQQLNQTPFFKNALAQITRHTNPKLASAAVKTIRPSEHPAAETILHASLNHPDDRVRANTLEALAPLIGEQHLDHLEQLAKTENNRTRANAIGVLMDLRFDQAVQLLENMLQDPRVKHRISALWLVEHLNLTELLKQVAEMSISDKDPTTRQKAGKVINQFIDLFESSNLMSDAIAQPHVSNLDQTTHPSASTTPLPSMASASGNLTKGLP